MTKENELAMPVFDAELNNIYGGLTIFQELSARFMAAAISSGIGYNEFEACDDAQKLINEWNKREQSKTK